MGMWKTLLSVPNANPCRRQDSKAKARQTSPMPSAAFARIAMDERGRFSAAGNENDAGDDQSCAGDPADVERFMEEEVSQQSGNQEAEPNEWISQRQIHARQNVQPDQCSNAVHPQSNDHRRTLAEGKQGGSH